MMAGMWLQSAGGFNLASLSGLALPLLFVGVMYFLLIVPNQKKQKAWQQMLGGLKPGDRVTTSGGLRGVVLQVKEDAVLLRIAPDNLKMEFVKNAISAVTTEEEKA